MAMSGCSNRRRNWIHDCGSESSIHRRRVRTRIHRGECWGPAIGRCHHPAGLAIAVFLGFLVTLLRRRTASQRDTLSGATFGRHYWIVVAIEVVIGLAGIAVVDGLLHLPRATV